MVHEIDFFLYFILIKPILATKYERMIVGGFGGGRL